jgi:hypothetical protein
MSPDLFRKQEKEYIMITKMILDTTEITTIHDWDERAEESFRKSVELNPDWDPEKLKSSWNQPHPWTMRYTAPEGVNPLVLNTHGQKPFPDNQGSLEFQCTAEQLRGALEGSESSAPFHFVTQGDGWDYSRTMCNVSWKKVDDDWGLVDPDPSKIWIIKRDQIEDGKTYHVTCIGGWGYVFIHEINKEA